MNKEFNFENRAKNSLSLKIKRRFAFIFSNKRGALDDTGRNELLKWILGIFLLVLIVGGIILLVTKGTGALEYIKSILRGGVSHG